MSMDHAQKDISLQPQSTRGRLAVGFAMLGSPIAWALHLCVMYFLVQPVCRIGGENWFHIVTGAMLAVCVASAIVAWRQLRGKASFDDLINGSGSWRSFVALFGVTLSAISAYAIAYQWLPVMTVEVCAGMRPLQ